MDGPATGPRVRESSAPAKVNLALHVVGRRADGYHDLDSLVVFTNEGDHLSMQPTDRDELVIDGAFGRAIPSDGGNIVLRALELARGLLRASGRDLPPQLVHLRKELPPSSGIGGGSADAAALLRLVALGEPDLAERIQTASVRLGADVPMCIRSRNARVTGVGERIETVRIGAPVFLLLANPLVEVSTPAVFSRLARRDNAPMPPLPTSGFDGHGALVSYLGACRNDLGEAAVELAPVIGEALQALESLGASLARMSGSGATVFGLFPGDGACREAARRLAAAQPNWWVRATQLRSEDMP